MLTKSITKLLKKSARVICQPDESGVIYITDGHLLAVVTPEEYTKFIQPATQRPAGDFEIRDGQETPRAVDVKRLFADHLRHLDASAPLEFAPVTFRAEKLEIAAAYCQEKDKAKAQQADQWHDAFQAQEQRAAALQGQLEHTKANMAAVVEDKSRLARQLQAAQAAQPATVEATPQPAPKPAASLAENLSRIPGATVKIAGENSRAPVIWITAADPDAAEAIRRAGGRWAEKKSAFYISVA